MASEESGKNLRSYGILKVSSDSLVTFISPINARVLTKINECRDKL